jgi:hypothetical protein
MKSVSSVSLFALFLVFFAVFVNCTNVGIPDPLPVCSGNNDPCIWETVTKNHDIIKIVVISPGLGSIVDQGLLDLVIKAQLLGISVFARIETDLGKRALLDVKADIDLFINLYKIDGIFFDVIPTDCSCQGYFTDLYAYVKVKIGGLVVLNAKVNVPECFGLFADILVVFDAAYVDYLHYVPLPWFAKYPASTFWHVIRACPPAQQRTALLKAIKNKVGTLLITDLDVDVKIGDSGNLLNLNLDLLVRLLHLLNLDLFLNLKL